MLLMGHSPCWLKSGAGSAGMRHPFVLLLVHTRSCYSLLTHQVEGQTSLCCSPNHHGLSAPLWPCCPPRFQSVLVVRGSESVFRIMETNDFKQLPHITLAFRPGNDAAVKQVCGDSLGTSETDTVSTFPEMLIACGQILVQS